MKMLIVGHPRKWFPEAERKQLAQEADTLSPFRFGYRPGTLNNHFLSVVSVG